MAEKKRKKKKEQSVMIGDFFKSPPARSAPRASSDRGNVQGARDFYNPPPPRPKNPLLVGDLFPPDFSRNPPPPPKGPPSLRPKEGARSLDDLLNAFQGPSLQDLIAQIPTVDRKAYVAPFDEAEKRARDAYAEALPAIRGTYSDLTGALGGLQKDYSGQHAALNAELERRMGQGQKAVRAEQAPLAADLADQGVTGSLAAGTAAEMAQQRANMSEQAMSEEAMGKRLGQVQQQSHEARVSDAELAKSASLGNASTNLEGILQQIGIGRAEAERAYNSDVASRNAQVAQLKMDYDAQRAQMEQNSLKELDKLATTPREDFEKEWEARVTKNPKATRYFTDLTSDVKGSGPMAMTEALRALEEDRKNWTANIEGTVPAEYYGFTPNWKVLENWIRQYYDTTTKRVHPELLAQFGLA